MLKKGLKDSAKETPERRHISHFSHFYKQSLWKPKFVLKLFNNEVPRG